MTNLKKTLAVVLAFAMILSMGFSAFAYTDVAEGTKVAEAVGILSNLGVLTGFEDGTFKPDDTVTRAQMAAIICRTLGYEDQAQSSAGSTIFNDVAADHWASGYINVAQSLQIVNGYGDGNYGPEDQVTYEQVVKMIVVALGYELDAQSKGGWSTGYLAVASREGITKNANGTVGAPASRGTVAVLVYNSLEVRIMDQSSWSSSGADDEYAKTDETILSQYLEIQKVEGIVETVPYVDYAKSYTADMDQMITFASDAEYSYYSDGKLYDKPLDNLTYDVSLVPEANTMAGKKVIAYVGEDEDDETGNYMVYAIAEKQGANKVTKMSSTQLVTKDDKYWDEDGVIGYKEVGSSKISTLDLDKTVTVSVNFGQGSSHSVKDTEDLAAIFTSEQPAGTVELISNDANSKIDVIIVTTYGAEAVIEAVNVEDEMISFDLYTGDLEEIDTEDEDSLVVVIKDGAVATVEDLAANDTVSQVADLDDSFRILYVSSKTVTGTVDSYDDDYVEIAGEEYELSPLSTEYSSTSDLSGKEGIFFLNVDGQIAYDEAEASKGNYAVVLAAGTTTGINSGYEVEVVLADGTVATYGLSSKAKVYDATETQKAKDEDEAYAYIRTGMTAEDEAKTAYRITEDKILDSVYEITVKNGEITKLEQLAKDSAAKGKTFDEENMSYGSISFNEATVIISVDADAKAPVESDDIIVGTVADFMVDGEGEDADLASFDEDNNDIAGLVVGKGLAATIPQDGAAFIITSVKTKEIDNDDAYVITGVQAGEKVTYTVYDDDPDYDYTELQVGNVILLAVANSEGIVKDFELLYDYKGGTGLVAGIADKSEEYYYAGTINKGDKDSNYEPTNNKFYFNTTPAGEFYVVKEDGKTVEDETSKFAYSSEDGVTMRASANYTLVDYSESTKNPEVSKKSKSKSIFGTLSKYDSEVFVRFYEDELVEVIVYRTNVAK